MKPTRERIEAATPEELRIWCAEMMGWRWWTDGEHRFLIPSWRILLKHSPGARQCRVADMGLPLGVTAMLDVPEFSAAIAAAWRVIVCLREAGCNVAIEFTEVTNEWQCRIESWSKYIAHNVKSSNTNEILAICRAALLWWIEQEGV